MKRKLIVFIAATIAFASCTKEETTYQQKSIEYQDISNTQNPFDYIGQIHNEGLNYLLDNCIEWSDQEIDSLVRVYLDGQLGTSNDTITWTDNSDLTAKYLTGEENASLFLLSTGLVRYLDSLRNYSIFICSRNSLVTPADYSEKIISFETELMNLTSNGNDSILSHEVNDLLCVFALARYSYAYWYSEYYSLEHLWRNTVSDIMTKDNPHSSFWSKIGNFFRNAVESVVAVACTTFNDSLGFFSDFHLNEGVTPGIYGWPNLGNAISQSARTWRSYRDDYFYN